MKDIINELRSYGYCVGVTLKGFAAFNADGDYIEAPTLPELRKACHHIICTE